MEAGFSRAISTSNRRPPFCAVLRRPSFVTCSASSSAPRPPRPRGRLIGCSPRSYVSAAARGPPPSLSVVLVVVGPARALGSCPLRGPGAPPVHLPLGRVLAHEARWGCPAGSRRSLPGGPAPPQALLHTAPTWPPAFAGVALRAPAAPRPPLPSPTKFRGGPL